MAELFAGTLSIQSTSSRMFWRHPAPGDYTVSFHPQLPCIVNGPESNSFTTTCQFCGWAASHSGMHKAQDGFNFRPDEGIDLGHINVTELLCSQCDRRLLALTWQ
ncbi:hypothetical protein TREES_T100016273 [Tupaia chinensis]|uniref:Uncharacterized protein n=1 Tax=Tupaia chinensis TaxID=246437 RepID=L9JDK6_TUPCH|nr:hypothetical protein TREES_T100016273 [Tupaia chinensis]